MTANYFKLTDDLFAAKLSRAFFTFIITHIRKAFVEYQRQDKIFELRRIGSTANLRGCIILFPGCVYESDRALKFYENLMSAI